MNLKTKSKIVLVNHSKPMQMLILIKKFIHSLEIASELLIDTFKSKGKVSVSWKWW